MDRVMKIESIKDLIGILNNTDVGDKLFYRGHADKTWKLIPSVFREEFKGKEIEFYQKMYLHNTNELEQQGERFEQLALLQHYSVPTRLLDWTRNPLVALYFATDPTINADGELIVYQPDVQIASGAIGEQILSILAVAITRRYYKFETFLDRIDRSSRFNINCEEIEENWIDRVMLILPKITNKRLAIQEGCFTIHGNKIIDKDGKRIIDRWECSTIPSKDITDRVLIPKESKEIIRQELRGLGYDEGKLFPDMENYAKYLKNKLMNKR